VNLTPPGFSKFSPVTGSESEPAVVRVRLQPRASANEVVGERDGVLVVRVTAPPVAGKANEALRALVAKRLGVAKGRVQVVRGAKGRDKVVEVHGLATREARRRLRS
jgi:uncharacterized protein (TIGR00251 family)